MSINHNIKYIFEKKDEYVKVEKESKYLEKT